MKSLRFLLLSVLASFLFLSLPSCVSSRKYDAAQSSIYSLRQDSLENFRHRQSLEEQILALQQEYTSYQGEAADERAALLAQLDAKSAVLSEKDQTLQARAERLRQLQDQIDEQNAALNKLRKTVSDALVNFNSDELTVKMKGGYVQVSLSDQLLFESASAKMDPKGKDALGKLSVVLKNNIDIEILVVGHTDSLPIKTVRYKDNWDLSVDRAVSVVRLLTDEYGLDGKRVQASGRSSYFPMASNSDKEGRAMNRRTEILLAPKLEELFQVIDSPPSGN
jgi:chemotaxis protein MotB